MDHLYSLNAKLLLLSNEDEEAAAAAATDYLVASNRVYNDDQWDRLNKAINIFNNHTDTNIELADEFEINVASIINHSAIDPIYACKVYKNFDQIFSKINSNNDLLSVDNINFIKTIVNETKIEINDEIFISENRNFNNNNNIVLSVMPKLYDTYEIIVDNDSSTSNYWLDEFQKLIFNDVVQQPYLDYISFSHYIVRNILHMYKIENGDVNQLLQYNKNTNTNDDDDDDYWQASLAHLIHTCGYSDEITRRMFIDDYVYYKNEKYDLAFVPKFPNIYNIYPLTLPQIQDLKVSNDFVKECVNFYHDMDPQLLLITDDDGTVPKKYLQFFKIFPFKSGHYIHPTSGKCLYIQQKRFIKKNIFEIFTHMECKLAKLYTWINDILNLLTFDDILTFTIISKSLNVQALGLMSLRKLCGAYLELDNLRIKLPTNNEMFEWLDIYCTFYSTSTTTTKIILPVSYEPVKPFYISLINDIVQGGFNELIVTCICANYKIPERYLYNLHKLMKTPEQLYVFYTLLIQEYPLKMYQNIRDKLKTNFGKDFIDFNSKYKPNEFIQIQNYNFKSNAPKIKLYNSDNKEFNEKLNYIYKQLNDLIMNNEVELNTRQIVNKITLLCTTTSTN